MKASILAVVLLLTCAACAASTTINEQVSPSLPTVAPAPTATPTPVPAPAPTPTPAPLMPTSTDTARVAAAMANAELNQPDGTHPNARFDLFVQYVFEDFGRQPLAELRDIVAWRCEGAPDDAVRAADFRDTQLQRVLAIDAAACAQVAQTQLPVPAIDPDARTWPDAVEASYARTIPWASIEDFTTYLQQACLDPTTVDPTLWANFSSSMRVETLALATNDACEMPGGPRTDDDLNSQIEPFNPQVTSDGTPIVPAFERVQPGNVRLNFWIYFVRNDPSDDASAADLFRTHAWRGETQRLTDFRDVRGPGVEQHNVRISPDQQRIAYVVDVASGLDRIFVSGVDVHDPIDLGWMYPLGHIHWTADSRELLLLNEDEDAIEAVDATTGVRRTLLEAEPGSDIGVIGLVGNHLVHWQRETQAGPHRIVRRDLATGAVVDEFELAIRSEFAWAPDRSHLFLIDRTDPDDSRVLAVDLTTGGLAVTEIPAPVGYESDLAVSPDGTRLSYASGPAPHGREVYFVNLNDVSEVLQLTGGTGIGAVDGLLWGPASKSVTLSYGFTNDEDLYVLAEDGTPFDIETDGIPVAILLEEDK